MNIQEQRLSAILSRAWWMLLARGVIAILFAVMCWTRPGISLAALMWVFATYTLADGILGVVTAITGRNEHEYWWVLLIQGIIGIGVGLMTFAAPGVTALIFLFYIAIWAITKGVLEIVAAIRLRKEIEGEWLLILGGLVSVVFGAALMAHPGAGALAMLWLIAAYAFIFGVILVILAFRVRGFAKRNA